MKRLATQEKTLITEPTKKRDVKASKKVVDIKEDVQNDVPAGKYCGSGSIDVMLA